MTNAIAAMTLAMAMASPKSVEVLSEADMRAARTAVPEAMEVAQESFPGTTTRCSADPEDDRRWAWVQSAVRGSFTSAGTAETVYSIRVSKCNDLPSAPAEHYLVIYREGNEVWRTEGPEAVKAVDMDLDGQDEWLGLSRWCAGICRTEAWVSGIREGLTKTLIHVEEAERSECQDGGGTVVMTTVRVTGGTVERKTTTRQCGK